MAEEVWLTKEGLRTFARARDYSEQTVTRLWVALARMDTELKKAGKPGFTVQVNTPPYREWVKSELTRAELSAGVRVALSTVRKAWERRQIKIGLVPQYREVSHGLLRQWLESFDS